MRRITAMGLLILTALGFRMMMARGPSTRMTAAPVDERARLLQMDRDFDQATAERGLAGWLRYFADDGQMFPDQGQVVRGPGAIGQAMAPAFAQAGFSLRWKPLAAEVSRAGDLGYTYGTYVAKRVDAAGQPIARYGKYVTIWKKQRDGTWKVVLDIGNTSPAPAEASGR